MPSLGYQLATIINSINVIIMVIYIYLIINYKKWKKE